jgi:hypothetical protein
MSTESPLLDWMNKAATAGWTPPPKLDRLETLANTAGGTHANMIAAHGQEREAQGRALRALVKAVQPALRAITSPMVIDFGGLVKLGLPTMVAADHVEGQFLRLGESTSGPKRTLYLDAAGLLWWANYDKRRWENITPEEAAAAAVWPVEAWVGLLSMACDAAAEGRAKKGTQAARKRAEQLGALAVLLDALAK